MVLEILCGFVVEANDRSRLGQYIYIYFLQFYRVSIRCKFINAFEASRGLIFICTQAGIFVGNTEHEHVAARCDIGSEIKFDCV